MLADMLISLPQLSAFLVVAVVVTLAPGPDNLMVLSLGVARGRRAGVLFGLGCALGCLNHTLLAALGVSALIAASPAAFTALKIAGGAYLIWLGIQAIRNARPHDGKSQPSRDAAPSERPAAANALKEKLGLDDVRGGLKPEEKVAAVRAFTENGQRVAMVGDGVNDAPSLAVAHVGVAMGARGSDAALEQADVVLMHDRLENFLAAFRVSQHARAIIRQNIVISLGTVVVLVGFALAGSIPLTVGVIGHEGSTVVVVLNSLRLLLLRR